MSRIPPLPRLPYFLLGALTVVSFGGPFAMVVVVRGGPSADWPPDRAGEWIVIGLVIGMAVALFSACVTMGSWYPWAKKFGQPFPSGLRENPREVGQVFPSDPRENRNESE